jgi:hypothetical protein
MAEYHIQRDEPCEPNWPKGAWSVYQIDGNQIADRIVRESIVVPDNGPAYYKGKVIARHSWCGYLGMFEKLEDAMQAIKDAEARYNPSHPRVMRKLQSK